MRSRIISFLLCMGLLSSCLKDAGICAETCTVTLEVTAADSNGMGTKALLPDETAIWILNLFVYDAYGLLDEHLYLDMHRAVNERVEAELNTILGRRCTIYAIANTGMRLPDYSMEELLEARWYMAYPDEYSHGMIQCGFCRNVIIEKESRIRVQLEHIMAKISLTMDRSGLNDDVEMTVTEVTIGNTPRSASFASPSSISGGQDVFTNGFTLDGGQSMPLNRIDSHGLSREVSLYAMENVRNGADKDLGTYVELKIDYLSDTRYSADGQPLVYRFLIHDKDDYSVRRNCHYHITVRPGGDGLSDEDAWRVDKSGLSAHDGQPYLRIVPSGTVIDGTMYRYYYQMGRTESRHFTLSMYPPSMSVHLREDMVEDERDDGRALYTMDPDGHGFTVKALGRSCISMMEIIPGPPLSDFDSETIAIEID